MKRKGIVIAAIVWMLVIVAVVSCGATAWIMGGGDDRVMRLVSEEEFRMIERYARLEEVRSTLEKDYYVSVDDETLVTGAIRGMMDSLEDPYTFYYTPEELKAANDESEGLYHGVGMVVQITEEKRIEIVRVYEGAPAQEAGLQSGDYLISVDGIQVTGENAQTLNEAVRLVQGEDGTSVRLGILREDKEMEFDVVRAAVNVSYVNYELIGSDIGYVNISQFTGDDVTGFEEAVSMFRSADVRGVVVDLRNNPGGMLDHVVSIADLVLPEGLITYVEDREGNRREERSDAEFWDVPMVVLVNGMSASASELFSAAVQDYDRAAVVGTTTFGKGIVQTLITFAEDGAGMQYTTESYFSPNGRIIHKTGVEPDVVVEWDGIYDSSVRTPDPENDNQLAAALDELERRILAAESEAN